MKGASKVIMGATLVMVVSLAIVLGLVLVLLAELYCTLLLRRRRLRVPTTTTVIPASPITNISSPETSQSRNHSGSPRSYYPPGVLQAPRSLFYPAVSHKENKAQELHHILDVHTQEESHTLPRPIRENKSDADDHKSCVGRAESLVYISNPIYDNGVNRLSRVETPFETPDSSPSRLERGGSSSSSSGEEEINKIPLPASSGSLPVTPPLSPMKKLPAEACSVSLRDARSLGTSGSDSVSNNGISSSSSSGSPCTSPSW